jgi:hypothetical protein
MSILVCIVSSILSNTVKNKQYITRNVFLRLYNPNFLLVNQNIRFLEFRVGCGPESSNGHLLLYTLRHIEPLNSASVRPQYNELTLQLATAACHVQRPNRNYLTKTSIKLQNYIVVNMSGKYLEMCCKPCYA